MRTEISTASAQLVSERLFATAGTIDTVVRIRNEVFGDIDDGVAPTRIVVSSSPTGPFPGVQIHAIRNPEPPKVFRCCGQLQGAAARVVKSNGNSWLFLNGLNAAGDGIDEAEQARRMFYCAGCFLRQAGATMNSVPRTWLWLKDVCDWYDDFNAARTSFFKANGVIDDAARTARLPASTGIGLHGFNGAACTLDLIALVGREDEIELVEAGGDQRSAYEYGSAFSRASVAPMPSGKTVFISGTAAIDDDGNTEYIGQIEAQIDGTITHVRSLLADLDCDDSHVLTALAYCKDEAVERALNASWTDLPWPRVTMIGDVCRPELLFEIEVTASPEYKGD